MRGTKFLLFSVILWACAVLLEASVVDAQNIAPTIYGVEVMNIDNKPVKLSDYKGSVALIVNTASKCGFTPQYKDLQALYEKYKTKGFVVLGFPSNDFMSQEPGSNEDIKRFCSMNYGVNFPMFSKASVKGAEKQPLFKLLTEQTGTEFAGEVGWNFEKFLVDKSGKLRARFGSFTNPGSSKIERKLEELLAEPST